MKKLIALMLVLVMAVSFAARCHRNHYSRRGHH
jgi:hypothetical protein